MTWLRWQKLSEERFRLLIDGEPSEYLVEKDGGNWIPKRDGHPFRTRGKRRRARWYANANAAMAAAEIRATGGTDGE